MTPPTGLARLIAARDRYIAWSNRQGPSGAIGGDWAAWRDWVNARRQDFAAEIKAAMEEKRFNQRRKANERKRDHGKCAPRGN